MSHEFGERMTRVETEMKQVRYDLYGNGKPGLVPQLQDFLAVQRDREKQELKRDRKLKTWIAIGGAALTASNVLIQRVMVLLHH